MTYQERKNEVINEVKASPTAHTMAVIGRCSDVQELIRRGNIELALEVLNDIKIIVDHYAPKDSEGRHNARNV